MKEDDYMYSKLWNGTDKRDVDNNTLKKEIDRLERVAVALRIAVEEKRKRHYENDFEELGKCIAELRRLVNELGE